MFNETSQATPREVLCDSISMQCIRDVVPAIPRDDVLCDHLQFYRDAFHAMLNARGLLVGRGTARNLVGVCRIFRTLRNSPMFPRFSMRQFSARRRLLCIFPCRARNSNGPIRLHLYNGFAREFDCRQLGNKTVLAEFSCVVV